MSAASQAWPEPPLTWLYVPADRSDLVPKALASTADVVILDLEDAVGPAHKEAAREAVVGVLSDPAQRGRRLEVRINDPHTPWGIDDLVALGRIPPAGAEAGAGYGLRIPKVADPEPLHELASTLGHDGPRLTPILESALGIERAFGIATAHPLVGALAMGEADLAADLGVPGDAGLTWARARVINAARAAGLPSPAMSAWLTLRDLDGLAASCRAGRAMGFLGRAAIHPSQLPVIEQAFVPSDQEVDAAHRTIEALEGAQELGRGGAVLPDGRFVDRAHIAGAHRTLALAARRR